MFSHELQTSLTNAMLKHVSHQTYELILWSLRSFRLLGSLEGKELKVGTQKWQIPPFIFWGGHPRKAGPGMGVRPQGVPGRF